MDLLTHAALGAAAGAAIARTPLLRHAALVGALAGVLPDADMLIASEADTLLNLEYHRHFTHSLLFAPLGAALAAAAGWLLLRRRLRFGLAYAGALAAYLTAILLDACTSYGTHLLWPFSNRPVSASIVSVIDPLFTVAVLLPLTIGLVRGRAAWARVALALAVGGLAVGLVQHERAAAEAQRLAQSRGHAPQRLLVKPTLGNLVLWRSLYLHDGRFYADAVRVGWPGAVTVYPGESAPRYDLEADAALPRGTRARLDVERFVAFTGDMAVRHPARGDVIGDARYSMLPTGLAPLWGVALADDPAEPVRFETLREWSPVVRARFVDMLLGRR